MKKQYGKINEKMPKNSTRKSCFKYGFRLYFNL